METVLKKRISIEHKRHDFDNGFSYVEIWVNSRLKNNYFAEAKHLFPDGTPKSGCVVYFYSPYKLDEAEKEVKPVKNIESFRWWHQLYFYETDGTVCRLNNFEELVSDEVIDFLRFMGRY